MEKAVHNTGRAIRIPLCRTALIKPDLSKGRVEGDNFFLGIQGRNRNICIFYIKLRNAQGALVTASVSS